MMGGLVLLTVCVCLCLGASVQSAPHLEGGKQLAGFLPVLCSRRLVPLHVSTCASRGGCLLPALELRRTHKDGPPR
eukprot:CAMPEP_0169430450 /NCGR_PEP_ID=MMETSP1042-20121227/2405_1 /TAXON_ID=464988 /ORGANISM="Hemiselmis andersenii, Strain CCMP1180" /LENGTH=75 /DNA_ID=CAMNT_0009540765 /DNA_START=139 /DNA_END=362 /DNA_ORIENTATION=+